MKLRITFGSSAVQVANFVPTMINCPYNPNHKLHRMDPDVQSVASCMQVGVAYLCLSCKLKIYIKTQRNITSIEEVI